MITRNNLARDGNNYLTGEYKHNQCGNVDINSCTMNKKVIELNPENLTITVLEIGHVSPKRTLLDENGKYFLYGGGRGLEISEGVGQTGTASADLNGFNLTFTGEELDLPYEVSSSLITTLTTPA